MDLRELAETDLSQTLEEDGQTVTVTSPEGHTATVSGTVNDINLLIDPETGVPVNGRNINASLRLSTLRAEGMGIPKGVGDTQRLPWVLEYTPSTGVAIRTKVLAATPDRTLGTVLLRLELIA